MNTLSEAEIIGHAGGTPEVRTVAGRRVATFSVATDRDNGRPQWHTVECWESRADLVARHVTKGRALRVRGRLVIDRAPHRVHDDVTMTFIKIIADDVRFLDSAEQPAQDKAQTTAQPEARTAAQNKA